MATATKSKKTKKKAKPKKPQWTAAEMNEFMERAGRLEDEARDHESKMNQFKAQQKAQKEMMQGARAELSRVLFEMHHPEALPLFNCTVNGQPATAENVKDAAAGALKAAEGEAWRSTPIKDALPNMPKKFYELCESNQLDTIGKLFDWKNEREHRRWKDLGKGVGPATFDKLDDAIEAFVAAHFNAAKENIGQPDEAKPA